MWWFGNIANLVLGVMGLIPLFDITSLWCAIQENTPSVSTQRNLQDGPVAARDTEGELKVTVERELVSQAEEEDMEALLGTYVSPFICEAVKAGWDVL